MFFNLLSMMPLYDPVCLLWILVGMFGSASGWIHPHVVSSMFLVSSDNVKTLVMECIFFVH